MELTKKYRVIYDSYTKEIIINPYTEYSEGLTLVGKGREASEFDTLQEVESFISENNLVYEPAIED